MLSSFPPIAPRDSHTLWYTPLTHNPSSQPLPQRPSSPPLPNSPQNAAHNQHNQHHHHHHHHNHHHGNANPANRRPNSKSSGYPLTPLTILALDETRIAARKESIRRFGYTWLKPAGVAKTMQGREEELLEREEMEEVERRESERLHAVAMEELGFVGGEDGMMMGIEGRDLDDEVPDADALDDEDDDEDEDEDADDDEEDEEDEDEDDGRGGWGSEDEDDDVPGVREEDFEDEDPLDPEDGGFEGVLGPRMVGAHMVHQETMATPANATTVVDLDDDIPDADEAGGAGGEWEHTDTDEDDDESEDMEEASFMEPVEPRRASAGNIRAVGDHARRDSGRSWSGRGPPAPGVIRTPATAVDVATMRNMAFERMTPEQRVRWSSSYGMDMSPVGSSGPRPPGRTTRGRGRGREN